MYIKNLGSLLLTFGIFNVVCETSEDGNSDLEIISIEKYDLPDKLDVDFELNRAIHSFIDMELLRRAIKGAYTLSGECRTFGTF